MKASSPFNFISFLRLTNQPAGCCPVELKYFADRIGAAILIILLLPLFVLVAVSVVVFSRGPIFFVQQRCGLQGRLFNLYKFRTMVDGAEALKERLNSLNEADGPVFKIKRDPRIVPYLGTFLRRTGLDELPQLFNVIKGEMSIVGPRPPIPSEVNQYNSWQRRRLSVRPGITCLWQCSRRRHDISFKDWIDLDLNYIDSWSPLLDMKILIKTTFIIFTMQGR
jgi:lipopolysaccharide/colanic/teichoic acid biosynthesis glycosyltransferase